VVEDTLDNFDHKFKLLLNGRNAWKHKKKYIEIYKYLLAHAKNHNVFEHEKWKILKLLETNNVAYASRYKFLWQLKKLGLIKLSPYTIEIIDMPLWVRGYRVIRRTEKNSP
jgi:hypothetical protein